MGDSDPPLIEDHQIGDLVGVQKRRLFKRDVRVLVNATLSASRTKFILNSDS
ncbi:hypothetical protein H6H01_24915 [Nostoc calcicola FACHB-3891]|nr:hypothetical protein [Nostoc calcicola FACHB-3891]MDZ8058528.1 hypothetical protein [Nostoc sp. EkiNYC01]